MCIDSQNRERENTKMGKQKYFPVDNILAKRVHPQNGLEYLIHWQGLSIEKASWQPVDNLDRCKDKLAEFEAEQMHTFERQGVQIQMLERFIQNHLSQVAALADATSAVVLDALTTDQVEEEEEELPTMDSYEYGE